MRYELKSIPIWSFVKVGFFINLISGFILGFFYGAILSFITTVMSRMPFYQGEDIQLETFPTGIFMIFMPFFMAFTMGFLNTFIMAILALIYNLIAKFVGGIELNLQPTETPFTDTEPGRVKTTGYHETDPYRAPPPPPSWRQPSPPPRQETDSPPDIQGPSEPDQSGKTDSTDQN